MAKSDNAIINKQRQDALQLFFKGSIEEAAPLLRAALHQVRDGRDVTTYMLMQRVAECFVAEGKFKDAEPLAAKAIFGFSKWGPDDDDVLDCKYLMAEILKGMNKNAEAVDIAKTVAEQLTKNRKRGPDHATTLKCKALYAMTLKDSGSFIEARAYAEDVRKCFDATTEKIQICASIGSRRLTRYERMNMAKVEMMLEKVLGERLKKRDASGSKMTVTTHAPDSDDEAIQQL